MPALSRLTLRPLLFIAGLLTVLVALLGPAAGASAATPKQLSLVLPLVANDAGIENFANQVSNPKSPEYGHYQTVAQLAKRFGASRAAEAKVVAYLKAHGATRVKTDATGLFVDATLPTATAETLFRTEEREVRSIHGDYVAPASAATIPAALSGLVSGVVGLDTQSVAAAPAIRREAVSRSPFRSLTAPISRAAASEHNALSGTGSAYSPAGGTPSGCAAGEAAGGFTPSQYLGAYNYTGLQAGGKLVGQGETVALIEIDGYISSDVRAFASCFGLHVPKIVGFAVGSGVGSKGLTPGGESDLDLEVLTAAAPGLKGIDVYETESDAPSVLEALTSPLQNSGFEPQVISASLGLCEAQTEEAVGKAGINNTEAALAMASAAGVSFLAASGDDGSADCLPESSQSTEPEPKLTVNYPSSSAYATAVGGTNIVLNPNNTLASQTVWNDGNQIPGVIGAGGGGVSALVRHPSYQSGVISSSHRTVPDVALLADIGPGYDVYCTADLNVSSDGCYDPDAPQDCNPASSQPNCPWQPFGGTSAATPLLAGGVALIDQLLTSQKKQDLGLLNPLLYSLGKITSNDQGAVFDDVVSGSNDVGPYITGYAKPLGCCSAAPGYDEATGWGGVNVEGLATQALAVQPAIVNISQSFPTGQHPIASKEIVTRVTCSGHCRMGGYADVTVTGHKPLQILSGLYTLTKASTHDVGIHFTAKEIAEFSSALAHHGVVVATIYGAIVDPAGNVERRSHSVKIHLTS